MKVTLPYPPSANRYWKIGNNRVYVSDEARSYKQDVCFRLIANRLTTATGDVALTVRLFRPQKSGDLDNRLKVLLDAMQGVVYETDKQVTEIHAYRHDDKKNPRVEVEIKVLG